MSKERHLISNRSSIGGFNWAACGALLGPGSCSTADIMSATCKSCRGDTSEEHLSKYQKKQLRR